MREKGKKRNFRLKNTSTKTKIMFQNSIKTKEEAENLKHFILWAEIQELKRAEGKTDTKPSSSLMLCLELKVRRLFMQGRDSGIEEKYDSPRFSEQ